MFSQCVLVNSEHIKATPYEKSLNVSFKCSYFTIVLYTMYIYITVCIVGAPDCFFCQSRLMRIEIVAKIKVETI